MKKITINTLASLKKAGEKITCLTAYDASFAQAMEQSGIEVVLVGDSLGTVLQGNDTTLPVTIEDMVYHTRCVKNGNSLSLVITDMPFMSYDTLEHALENAAKLIQAGAHVVKLEGGKWLLETVSALTERGIPVCGHLGLTPQSINAMGGHRVQGKSQQQAQKILTDAQALQDAGASLLVVECIPSSLAKDLSQQLTIPVIGIGAGVDTDGQVLVMHDMLGIGKKFKHSRNFLEQPGSIADAFDRYISEVKNKNFPTSDNTFE